MSALSVQRRWPKPSDSSPRKEETHNPRPHHEASDTSREALLLATQGVSLFHHRMANERLTVTREELYELVWSTSMVKLAGRFGCSNVALAKLCKRMDVPNPGVGHWARIAAGQTPDRTPLPKAKQGTLLTAATPEGHVLQDPREPKAVPPVVVVPDRVSRPHLAVLDLRRALATARTDDHGRRRLPGSFNACCLISQNVEPRAVRILHALFSALSSRGATVALRHSGDDTSTAYTLQVELGAEEPIDLQVLEEVDREPREPTTEEKRWDELFHHPHRQRLAHRLSGRLRIRIAAYVPNLARRSWGDSKTQTLDALLGHVVLGVEEAAVRIRQARLEEQREEDERKEERRKGLREALEYWHTEALIEDLVEMANDWSRARLVHDFVLAAGAALPPDQRSDGFAAWLGWASDYADTLDPLTDLDRVAKAVEPDRSNIPEPTGDLYWQEPTDEEWHETVQVQVVPARRVL